MNDQSIDQHRAIVDLAVLVVSSTGAYFNAPIGSGEEEVNEETLDEILDFIAGLPGEAAASLVLALSSLIVAKLDADEVLEWADAETATAEGLR